MGVFESGDVKIDGVFALVDLVQACARGFFPLTKETSLTGPAHEPGLPSKGLFVFPPESLPMQKGFVSITSLSLVPCAAGSPWGYAVWTGQSSKGRQRLENEAGSAWQRRGVQSPSWELDSAWQQRVYGRAYVAIRLESEDQGP